MPALKAEYLPHYTYDDYAQREGAWELICGLSYAMALKFELYEREEVGYYVMVDPENETAKVYMQNGEGCYKKMADAAQETIEFELGGCALRFDFAKIWR